MNEAKKPEDAPGHYGAGYGEQVPEGAPARPAPVTDADEPLVPDTEAPDALLEPDMVITETVIVVEAPVAAESPVDSVATSSGDDGAPVVFTPDDVHARPPDRPPTEEAPESEKAGLIFERS